MEGIRTFEVYLVDDKPYGYEVEKPYPASAHGYEFAYRFTGKSAHIVIVSHDRNIDRPVALHFAKAVAFKTIKVFHIDLEEVNLGKASTRKTVESAKNAWSALLEVEQLEMEELF